MSKIGVKANDDSWAFSLWGRSLFDQYYWTAVASNANVVVRFPAQARTWAPPPRSGSDGARETKHGRKVN